MMACIYTNTQTCTYTVHTVYLYTYCTHAHICIYICASIRYGSDPTTVTNWWDLEAKWTLAGLNTVWFIISMVHWESWWYCENVALFPFFYFSRYVLFFVVVLKASLLYCRLQCDKHFALYISLFQASHYSSKQLVFCFVFLWSDAFYQSNRLAAVFEWPGPHTHTSQTVQTQNKCTDNQREREGGIGTPAKAARLTCRAGPCWARAIWKSNIGHVYMHPCCPRSCSGYLHVKSFAGAFDTLSLGLPGAINEPVNGVVMVEKNTEKIKRMSH